MRVPLYQILKELSGVPGSGKTLDGLERVSEIDLPSGKAVSEGCYAVNIEEDVMVPVLKKTDVAVFAPQGESGQALMNVFLVGMRGQPPQVRVVVKNEKGLGPEKLLKPGSPASDINQRRKSFMTPTPLHIPGSRVSPIPGSAHEMVYLKSFQPEHLSVVPAKEVLWMHPLIHVHSI